MNIKILLPDYNEVFMETTIAIIKGINRSRKWNSSMAINPPDPLFFY